MKKIIFIAELGDKTQIATLTISGTNNRPLAVFLGSASALVFASLIGALAGGSISTFIPEVYLKFIACKFFSWILIKKEIVTVCYICNIKKKDQTQFLIRFKHYDLNVKFVHVFHKYIVLINLSLF